MIAALLIFILTLVFVIWQPRGLGIGYSALGGAAIALMFGVINWGEAISNLRDGRLRD